MGNRETANVVLYERSHEVSDEGESSSHDPGDVQYLRKKTNPVRQKKPLATKGWGFG